MKRFTYKDLKIKNCEPAYDGFFKIDRLTFDHARFDGGVNRDVVREVLVKSDTVSVLAYDPKRDEVLLVEQVRGPLYSRTERETPWSYEIIAGMIDTDESPEEVAIREAEEEAGITIERLIPITSYYDSTGMSGGRMHLFLGLCSLKDAGGIFGLEAESEDIRAFTLSRETALAWIDSGKLDNGFSIIAMLWLKLNYHHYRKEF